MPPLRLSFGFRLHFILEIIPVNFELNPRNFLLGLCRTGILIVVNKASVPGWPKVVVSRHPAYQVAQYDEAQETQLAEGRFQKAACIVEDLALKARPRPG